MRVKSILITLGSHYSQLKISKIIQKSQIEEKLIVQTINKMIENNEIEAEFLLEKELIIFEQTPNIHKIDELMISFKEWEEKESIIRIKI